MITVTIAIINGIHDGRKVETTVSASHRTYREALDKANKLAESVMEDLVVLDKYVKDVSQK